MPTKPTPPADAQTETTICRIRQRDTGGIREISEAQWRKNGKQLRAEGYAQVDADDQAVTDDTDGDEK